MMWRICTSLINLLTLCTVASLFGLFACNTPARAFDHTNLAMWLDASDINGTGTTGNNPAYLSSVNLWVDKSGNGNNAFVTPMGDPPGGTIPGADGGLAHAEVFGPLPPAPVLVDHNAEPHTLSPSGLPAVRFNTCNNAPQFPGCNVTPPAPAYPNQTGLMTNYHAHPDPAAIGDNLHLPAKPDLTVVAVVRPWFIQVASYHPIWTFDGNLGGHNRSLGIHYNPGDRTGLNAGNGVVYDDSSLDKWMILVSTYDYNGTAQDPTPQSPKLYVNSAVPILASGPESISQSQEDSPMTIGWFPYNYVQGNNISMLLSEFLVFERTLSDAEVNSLGFELAHKYGIATSFTSPGVPGDYNSDGIVDAADYTVWRDHLGQTFTLPNEDPASTPGQVTIEDYNFWKAHFGATSGSGSTSGVTVPEPSSWVMLLFAGAGTYICRRRRD